MRRRSSAASLGALALGTLALAGCMSLPPDEDPVQIKLADLDTRLTRIERVMQNQSLLDVANQLEALRADVRAMHNDVDQLNNNLDAAKKQQQGLYADLDQRIKVLEARGGGPAAAPAAAEAGIGALSLGGNGGNGGGNDDKSMYQTGFNALKDGQYDRAIQSFQSLLAVYPSSPLADNAQYWLGEAYYVNKSFSEAQSAFQRVVDKYPSSRKVPDALLKLGYCRYEMKLYDAARAVLNQVVSQYPDTPAAKLARDRLGKMTAESH